jgi:hypothetical protein
LYSKQTTYTLVSQYKLRISMTRFILAITPLLLAACSTTTQSRLGSAAVTPLSDLNIVGDAIPAVLQAAMAGPYGVPQARGCAEIKAQIAALDTVLPPDLDAPPPAESSATHASFGMSLMERGTAATEDAAIAAVQRSAEGVLPFRTWIRKLSGAESAAKKAVEAVAAGTARRTFLKGLSAGQNCQ